MRGTRQRDRLNAPQRGIEFNKTLTFLQNFNNVTLTCDMTGDGSLRMRALLPGY
jgi:hypothetical protein